MIFPSNRVRIVAATKPVDFRKDHDGLAALVRKRCPNPTFLKSA
ncbi:conserved hypothetical protein [Rhodobacteraceae bacterium KLH11]|nr:conserved hypothetical protein [Rhodobacteraceae bacterium KLH11]